MDQLLKENDEGIGGSSTTDLQSESASMPPDDHDQDSNDLIRSTGHEEYDQILAKSKKKDDLIDQPSDFDQTPSSQLIVDWKHDPIELYKSTCHYVAFYLGSTSIEHLQGLKSSEQSMRQLRRMLSQNQIGKVPAVIISISYKGVRFIDVLNNVS